MSPPAKTDFDTINKDFTQRAHRLLANGRLIGMDLEHAQEIIKAYGFMSEVYYYSKSGKYGLVPGDYQPALIKLFVNEGETVVITATHG